MFGTSGIRGVYGSEITEELAGGVASVFAKGRLAVGRDLRESGAALLGAVCRGAHSTGAEVIDTGIVPTPTLALAAGRHACRGIMITASHNPPEYNGLKLVEGTKEIGKELERAVTDAYGEWKRKGAPAGKRRGGTVEADGIFHDGEAIAAHKELIFGLVDSAAVAKGRPKVVVDCNGAAAVITPQLLTDLGCRVVSVNASPACFNRPSEPSAANVAYLSGLIRDCGADFAIAHDGDGDRCMIMDERGEMLPLDAQLAMMIEHELGIARAKGKKREKIISTVEASLTVREAAERAGASVEITPVGSTYVGEALEAQGALFGGEPCGEFVYAKGVHVPDAVLAAAKFAEIFCSNGPFSKLAGRYPQNFMHRAKFPAKDKRAAMEGIVSAVRGLGIDGRVRDDDGVRVDEEDGWFLIRASGTEPIVRLTMEYKGKARLDSRRKGLESAIRRFL